MLEGYIAGKFANKMFEQDVFKTIKNHAFGGALIMMIPDFGFGTLFFIAVLWHMYSSICNKVGVSFSDNFWKLVGLGIFVNIAIAFAIDLIFTALFFLEPFIMYFQFYMSGKLFVESLKGLDGHLQHTASSSPSHDLTVSSSEEPKALLSEPTEEEVSAFMKDLEEGRDSQYQIETGIDQNATPLKTDLFGRVIFDEPVPIKHEVPAPSLTVEARSEEEAMPSEELEPDHTNPSDRYSQLYLLKDLLDKGILTIDEFEQQKQKILTQ